MDALVARLHAHYLPPPPSSKFWFWVDEDRPAPMIRDIQRAVIEDFGGTLHELLSSCQRNHIVLPRYVGMYLSRKLTKQTVTRIGHAFRRDHTVVLAANRRIANLIGHDLIFAARVAQLEARFA